VIAQFLDGVYDFQGTLRGWGQPGQDQAATAATLV